MLEWLGMGMGMGSGIKNGTENSPNRIQTEVNVKIVERDENS